MPVLAPAEWVYRGAVAARSLSFDRGWRPPSRALIPVVSVGNLTVGGTGKTPVAAWLARRLLSANFRPAVVLRGYGSDEVKLHRELNPDIPVLTARRKIVAVNRAAATCDVAVLDDGFQHRTLARDVDLVLIAAERWTSRKRLLPRGPWREPHQRVRRASAVLITYKTASDDQIESVRADVSTLLERQPLSICQLTASGLIRLNESLATGLTRPLSKLRGRRVVAVTAVADPYPFVAQLRTFASEVDCDLYPDHYEYTAMDADKIVARANGRPILMTGKDAVKLRPLLPVDALAYVVTQEVRFREGEDRLLQAVFAALPGEPR